MFKKLSMVLVVMLALSSVMFFNAVPSAEAATYVVSDTLTYDTGGDMSNPYDTYQIWVEAGEMISVTMVCDEMYFDPLLIVTDSADNGVAFNDDGYGGTDPCGYSSYLTFAAPASDWYTIWATSFGYYYDSPFEAAPGDWWESGPYTLTITGNFEMASGGGGINDGRLCMWDNYAVYTGSGGIQVYTIWQGKGSFKMQTTAAELAAVPGTAGVNTLVEQSADGQVSVYRLGDSNTFQVVAGLDFVRFSGLPASNVDCGTINLGS